VIGPFGVRDAPIAIVPIVGVAAARRAARKKPRAAAARAVFPRKELSLNA